MPETLTLINGNKNPYTLPLPLLVIKTDFINDGGLAHILENTGLHFQKGAWNNYEAQPTASDQIVKLFLTYDFKTRFYDNASAKNTLFLKFDHHVGFDVDSICIPCAKENHIYTHDLPDTARLAC